MIILLACGAFWLFAFIYYQASLFEQRRKASLALRRVELWRDDNVRKHNELMLELSVSRDENKRLIKDMNAALGFETDDDLSTGGAAASCTLQYISKDDTREIPTIEAENADSELSDVWVNAIEELELE